MTKLQIKIIFAMQDFGYFSKKNFDLENENVKKLFGELNSDDQETFNFDEHQVIIRKIFYGISK